MKAFFKAIGDFFAGLFKSAPVAVEVETKLTAQKIRDDLVLLWKKDLSERETKGSNRSPLIDSICRFFGLDLGQPYCIGGLLYRADQYLKANGLKNPLPKTMSTQSFYLKSPETYRREKGEMPKKADICIMQRRKDANKGHAYALTVDQVGQNQKTIEYNTDLAGDRDGDGVYEQVRTQEGDTDKKYLGAVDVAAWILSVNADKVVTAPTGPTSVAFKADWDENPRGNEFTAILVQALKTFGQDMLTATVKDSAKWGATLNSLSYDGRLQFYVMLISSMARYESGFKPETSFKEGFEDSSGDAVISRGLLQISKESANQKAYAGNIKDASELHDPKINLEVGVRILNHWIKTDGYIGSKVDGKHLGGARYWSVLRDTSGSQAKIKAKTLGYCKGLK